MNKRFQINGFQMKRLLVAGCLAWAGCGSEPAAEDGFGLAPEEPVNVEEEVADVKPLKLPPEGHVPHSSKDATDEQPVAGAPPEDGADFQPVRMPIVPEPGSGGVTWEGHKTTTGDRGQRHNTQMLGRKTRKKVVHKPADTVDDPSAH